MNRQLEDWQLREVVNLDKGEEWRERQMTIWEERHRDLTRRREIAVAAGCVSFLGVMVALLVWAVVAMCRADAELAESEAALAAERFESLKV